jgi:hypothetical protein
MDHSFDWRGQGRQHFVGKEIYEIKPVILGGSPTDPANKAALTRREHIQAVNYWNRIIKDLRKAKSSN